MKKQVNRIKQSLRKIFGYNFENEINNNENNLTEDYYLYDEENNNINET